MKSSELVEFGPWEEWPEPALSRAPRTAGVYVFRLAARCFGRLKGDSDILRIGTIKTPKSTLKRRLDQYRSDEFIRRVGVEIGPVQVSWKALTCKEAEFLESDLLARYCQDHVDFPPGNRQQSQAKFQQAKALMEKLTPEERQKLKLANTASGSSR